MELSLSGNELKTFARCITCLARIGNELAIQASSSQFVLHTLNSSRSAYQLITFKTAFFDAYSVYGNQVQCSVLLKAVCSVLRTPVANIDLLTVKLPDSDASKLQWILEGFNGLKKTYWITCNVEPDIQHLSLDRQKFHSNLVVRPRDLNRLLANFQSSLQEITIIATDPSSFPSDATSEIGGKAVELRSYIDPTKENDSSLHTQLWIDPGEEFVQYVHTGDPVDVTFGVKELKAFLSARHVKLTSICILTKLGNCRPILMAPKFGPEDAYNSNFDVTLVLATMLTSQLHDANTSEPPQAAKNMNVQSERGNGSQQQERLMTKISEHPSDHTRIWSDLSGNGTKNSNSNGKRQVEAGNDMNANELMDVQRISSVHISKRSAGAGNFADLNPHQEVEKNNACNQQDRSAVKSQGFSQHHPSNWVDANEDDEYNNDEDEHCIQSTPPYYEEC